MFPSHPQPPQHFELQTLVVCSMNSGYALTRATSNPPNPPKLKSGIHLSNLSRFQFCCVCARGWHQSLNTGVFSCFMKLMQDHARSCKIMQNMHMEPNKAIKQPFFSTSRTKFIVLLAALSMPGGCFHSEAHSSACLAGQHSQNILRWGASSKR